ncbi:MAG: class I SAM-dependent methyltransferase [Xanthobacteraceae bacterium]
MRWLGLAAEPEDQRAFLFPALVEALARAGPRVLISGSADEAMAAMVVEAGVAASCTPVITALDRCATPLAINQSYAEHARVALSAVQTDILAYRPANSFDVIVTHSFLGQFDTAGRSRLIATWFALLASGGRVITVVRLRPAGTTTSFSGEAADRLAAEVRRRAAEHTREIEISPSDLGDAAHEYAQQRSPSHAVRDIEELVALFVGAGFELLHAQIREWPGRVSGIEGPGLPRGGRYAEIVAERR